mmetsp:Transcript_76115/g.221013  ORF Transcript_76115/g.221013 Transcript_76115/m.221013 type:complete len:240 (+) Transcript_76115:331-1050(+)
MAKDNFWNPWSSASIRCSTTSGLRRAGGWRLTTWPGGVRSAGMAIVIRREPRATRGNVAVVAARPVSPGVLQRDEGLELPCRAEPSVALRSSAALGEPTALLTERSEGILCAFFWRAAERSSIFNVKASAEGLRSTSRFISPARLAIAGETQVVVSLRSESSFGSGSMHTFLVSVSCRIFSALASRSRRKRWSSLAKFILAITRLFARQPRFAAGNVAEGPGESGSAGSSSWECSCCDE